MENLKPEAFEGVTALKARVLAMKEQASIYNDQYDDLVSEQEQLRQLSDNGSYLSDEEQTRMQQIERMMEAHTIFVKTLNELRTIQEALGKTEEEIRINLAHENAHANQASTLGVSHNGYRVIILRDGEIYQTNITFPDTMDPHTATSAYRQILYAPETYGHGGGLSDDDKQDLNKP